MPDAPILADILRRPGYLKLLVVCGLVVLSWRYKRERVEQARFERSASNEPMTNTDASIRNSIPR